MEENILTQLKELLDINDRDLKINDNFREYPEWDSIANLSVIAMIDEEYEIVLTTTDFNRFTTVGDIINEIKKRTK